MRFASFREELSRGEGLARLVLAHDWSATPVGPMDRWPRSLQIVLRILLGSRYAMWLGWGPELTFFYNDAYAEMTLGAKHPWALGRSAREVWAEIWGDIGPRAEAVMRTGVATWDEGLLLFLERSGYREETYHTFSYSPVPDDEGAVGGMLCVVTEDTERIIGERRLRALRELAADLASIKTERELTLAIGRRLASDARDLPFVLTYLLDAGARRADLAASSGIGADTSVAPIRIDLDDAASPWPASAVVARGDLVTVDDLGARFASLPPGAWDRPPSRAVLAPIAQQGHDELAGFLVAGLNPYRSFDASYRGFVELVAGQIAAGIANVRAYEQERRRAEALAELDRAKTAFFSNVSHEFRTPLTLMLGPIEQMLEGAGLSDGQREQLTLVHRNGQRLLKLVNNLLDFSRIEAGRADVHYEPTDIAALTADVASVFRSAVERAGMRLVIACDPAPEDVYVDREMWEKIVLNLVSNAFKYTLDGEIEVRLRALPSEVELSVRDTGSGIPEAELPKVWRRFHRVEGAKGRTHEGSGIGLALVHELVKLHGGGVSVESEVGRGSTFRIAIPRGKAHLPSERIAPAHAPLSTAAAASAFVEEALRWLPGEPLEPIDAEQVGRPLPSAERARVLLADDNADMRDYVRRLLSDRYDVIAVADGQEALERTRAAPPDLVVTDVMMPRLDGFGLLRALREDPRTATIPVIVLSARAGEEARVEGLHAGADDYLIKPFSARELVARVSGTLALARLRRDAVRREEELLRAAEEARAEAEKANRTKDEFLATLSHELRTPLNAILGWARILRTGRADGKVLADGLETIERNSKVQAQLIDDLLDLSRIMSGKLLLHVQRVNLVDVIEAAIDAVRPAAASRQIRIQPVLDPRAGPVSGDPARLQQIVWNLLSNAVKFTPRGGRVQVVLARIDSHAEIRVSDSGIGIKPDFLPFVFDRFRQADPSTTRKHGGLGLGLSIVRQLAEMHGGTVRAESPGEGQGATFSVELPIAAAQADADRRAVTADETGEHAAMPASLEGVKVLVIDDEADARDLIARILEMERATVRTAGTVSEALDAIRAEVPDVLLSDIGMPEHDGYELIRRVRALGISGRTLPAVALTAFARPEDRRRALLAGFQVHVPKPADPEELVTVVATLVGRTGGAAG